MEKLTGLNVCIGEIWVFSLPGEKKSKVCSISKISDSQLLCQKLYKTQDKN